MTIREDGLRHDLVFGLVGPVKTNLGWVGDEIEAQLRTVGYEDIVRIRISELLTEIASWSSLRNAKHEEIVLREKPEDERLDSYMEAGNAVRRMTKDPSILAAYAVPRISKDRDLDDRPRATIIHSLKTPSEVERLRRIYGVGFFLVGVSSPRDVRERELAETIARDRRVTRSSKSAFVKIQRSAARLVKKDEGEKSKFGQKLRETFHLSDFFLRLADDSAKSKETATEELKRFVELVMGNMEHTPRKDEYLMFQAYAAAMRSGALARQVGAALATSQGEVIGLGCNDVPRAGGGLYWSDDPDDERDICRDRDSSNELSEQMLDDLFDRLRDADLIPLIPQRDKVRRALRGSRMLSLLEFGRTTHAEMEAIQSAGRVGVSVRGTTLFTTTYPCHECARLILTAGIRRVVYVEPYPKSLATDLHADGIRVEGEPSTTNTPHPVDFVPFVGVGPRRYMDLFSTITSTGERVERKDENGYRIKWDPATATPKMQLVKLSYLEMEKKTIEELGKKLSRFKNESSDNPPRRTRDAKR